MEWASQRVKQSIRRMLRRPFFTLAVIGLFGLAGGLNTIVFSILNVVVFQAAPFPQADRLFKISCSTSAFPQGTACSVPVAVNLRQQSSATDDLTYYSTDTAIAAYGNREERLISVANVSSSFFSTLRRWPEKGRWFMTADNTALTNNLVVLSHSLWQKYFEGQSDILGVTISLNNKPFIVCGIMPSDFTFPDSQTDAWILDPLTVRSLEDVGLWQSTAIIRLKDQATQQTLRTELNVIAKRLSSGSSSDSGLAFSSVPMRTFVLGEGAHAIWLLFAATTCLLVLVGGSLVNLLALENISGYDDQLVRMTLGASRTRLLGECIGESLVPAMLASMAALAFAYGGLHLFQAATEDWGISRSELATIGPREWSYCICMSAIVFLVSALLAFWPLIHTPSLLVGRRSLSATKGHDQIQWRVLQAGAIILQLSMASVLLSSASAAARTLWDLLNPPLGFDSSHLVAFEFDPNHEKDSLLATYAFFHSLLADIMEMKGVDGAAMSSSPPLSGIVQEFLIPIFDPVHNWKNNSLTQIQSVSKDYFTVMKIPLLAGRTFTQTDNKSSLCVAVANQTFARSLLGLAVASNAIGRTVSGNGEMGGKAQKCSIVGVVGDIHDFGVEQPATPEIYFSDSQRPDTNRTLLVRTEHEATLIPIIRQIIQQREGFRRVLVVSTIRQFIGSQTSRPRILSNLVLLFAFAAFVVSIVGIFAIADYFVGEKRTEIAIRLVLGAERSGVVRLILSNFLPIVSFGIALGAVLAYGADRALLHTIDGLPSISISTLALAALILEVSCAFACALPVAMLNIQNVNSLLRSE